MEAAKAIFSLDKAITQWQQNLHDGSLTADDIAELTQHLQDELDGLLANKLTEEEAWLVATHRMGQPADINTEFSKVNPDFFASRNLLMLFWGGSIFMLLQTILFVLPEILTIFFVKRVRHLRKHSFLNDEQINILLYIDIAAIVVLLLFILTNSNKISIWFNNMLSKYSSMISIGIISVGLFCSYFNFWLISHAGMYEGSKLQISSGASQILGTIFYGTLIFCTAWFNIRYRKQEFRNFKLFSGNINWLMALTIGIMIEMLTACSHMFQSESIVFAFIVILFGTAGWMTGHSKTYQLNLVMIQASPLYLLIYFFITRSTTPYDFALEYLITIASLIIGCAINQKRIYQMKTS
jgi:hypothetical protein